MTRLFRVARPAATSWNVSKTLMQTGLFWATLLWLVPVGIVRFEAAWALPRFDFPERATIGWSVLVCASVLGLWTGWTMATRGQRTPLPLDTARKLVTRGPYRIVRNPMAVTGLTQGLGVALILGSWGVVLYVLFGGVLWHALVRPVEERDLFERFGEEYSAYRRQVGLWLPRKGAS